MNVRDLDVINCKICWLLKQSRRFFQIPIVNEITEYHLRNESVYRIFSLEFFVCCVYNVLRNIEENNNFFCFYFVLRICFFVPYHPKDWTVFWRTKKFNVNQIFNENYLSSIFGKTKKKWKQSVKNELWHRFTNYHIHKNEQRVSVVKMCPIKIVESFVQLCIHRKFFRNVC